MNKSKNIFLFVGVLLYILDVVYGVYCSLSWEANSKYFLTQVLISCGLIILLSVLPITLLILNLNNKYNKVFTIIVAVLSILILIYNLIDPYLSAVPEYLILSKLGLIDTYWVYIFSRGGIFRLFGSILTTIGAISSIKKEQKKSLDE